MKPFYFIISCALILGLSACSEGEEFSATMPAATNNGAAATIIPTAKNADNDVAYSANFPQPDGSKLLSGTDYVKFNTLIKAVDPQRALERSMLDITDEQFEEIKVAADKQCSGLTSNADKIATLNKWVHNYVTYAEGDNNAYQVFKTHKGVCQGYSNLLKAALISQGIPCVGVNGWYVTSYAYYGHAWTYACDITSSGTIQWYICDPTNSSSRYSIGSSSASHLQPEMADIILFEDEQFEYKWQYKGFNISRVKYSEADLVLPYSAGGFRLTMFNPEAAIPAEVENIYIGSNITSLGESYNIIGLNAYPAQDQMCYVDTKNKEIGSSNGVVYRKNYVGDLTSIYYIPALMTTITLLPIEKVEKNTIINQKGVLEIVFPEGTKVLESYAIESCPNLQTVYIPKGCKLEHDAIYMCPKDVQVVEGTPTGIHDIRI